MRLVKEQVLGDHALVLKADVAFEEGDIAFQVQAISRGPNEGSAKNYMKDNIGKIRKELDQLEKELE